MPAPALVSPNAAPEMTPFSLRTLALTVTRRDAVSVIAPVFWVRLAVPRKVRSAPSVTALVIVALTEASNEPPLTVSRPAEPPLPPKA